MIDLPLSTLTRRRSINERISYKEEKGCKPRRDYWYLFITTRREEVVVDIVSKKRNDGKQEVMFVQNGLADKKTVWKNLKTKAKEVREYYLPELKHEEIHWTLADVDGVIHNINDEVCL